MVTEPTKPILQGSDTVSFRDPTVMPMGDSIRVFYSYVKKEEKERFYWYTAYSDTADLHHWTEPRIITPKSLDLNFSSPGNIVRINDKWRLCLQTLPTPEPLRDQPDKSIWSPSDPYHVTGDHRCRLYYSDSKDLTNWSPPRLMKVKGNDIDEKDMGRMIDPFLIKDQNCPNQWWCLYKQDGMSLSYTTDFNNWTYSHRVDMGENVCALTHQNQYYLFHSPQNGIALKTSPDLKTWTNQGPVLTAPSDLAWASKRLTAGFVADLRNHPLFRSYALFFHGSSSKWDKTINKHGHCSLGIATSQNLLHWKLLS